ncbi:hypothetical protein BKI52_37365 [marine bacterium AO1-C]|nr:hypothetical protein BKI52_37365 [marine bacterium AO1-C]
MKQQNFFLITLCLTIILALGNQANTQAQNTTRLKIKKPSSGTGVVLDNETGGSTGFHINGLEKMRLMNDGRLHLNGSLIFNSGNDPVLYLGTGNTISQRFLQFIVSPDLTGAAGIKVGGLVVASSYGAYDPPVGNGFIQNYLQIGLDTDPTGITRLQVYGNAMKSGGGAWSEISDRLLKKDIQDFSDGLQTILNIEPKTYKYNGKGGTPNNGEKRIGVIAQDIESVAPYMVSEFYRKLEKNDATETRLLMYNSSALPYILVNAIKELNTKFEDKNNSITSLNQGQTSMQTEVETLKKANANLKSEVDTLTKENTDLKTKLADLETRLKSIEEALKKKE